MQSGPERADDLFVQTTDAARRGVPGAIGVLGAPPLLVVAGLVLLHVVTSLLGAGSHAALLLYGVVEAGAALTAALVSFRASRAHAAGDPGRTVWLLLGLGALSWGLGEVAFAVQDVMGIETDGTSWTDLPFLGWNLFSVAASMVHLRRWAKFHLGVRAALDGALLGLSLLTVAWVLWLGSAVAAYRQPLVELLVPVSYPVLDVVYLTAVLMVLRGGLTRPRCLVVVGAAAMAVADGTYFYGVTTPDGFQTGNLADLLWTTCFAMLALAARERALTPSRDTARPESSWEILIPYAALVPAAVFGAVRMWTQVDRFVLVLLVTMTVLAILRQFLVLDDHRRLLATTERQRELLEVVANVDSLTGLANRRRFSERLAEAVRSSLSTGVPVVVAFVDLDRFKVVNDTLGHQAGDELLKAVADRLASCVRAGDCAARWGGDEFAFLVTDPHADADAVVARLRAVMALPFQVAGTRLPASASIGAVRELPSSLRAATGPDAAPAATPDAELATAPDVTDLVDALLAAADAQMYLVKGTPRERPRVPLPENR